MTPAPSPSPWQPLFHGAEAEPFLRAVEDVAADLQKCVVDPTDWGRALVHAYRARSHGDEEAQALADRYVDDAIRAISTGRRRLSLYHGVAGVGWLAAHMDRLAGHVDATGFEEIDDALQRACETLGRSGSYDLVNGCIGIGVYFLERIDRVVSDRGLHGVVEALGRLAESDRDGLTWHTSPLLLPEDQRHDLPSGYYNLGVAHGVPGVVGLLGTIAAAGHLSASGRELLGGAARWVMSHRLADDTFPPWVAADRQAGRSRLAWCYGELGLTVAMLIGLDALAVPGMVDDILAIAQSSAKRRDSTTGVVDAGLCHGASGNAHLFNRLYQTTGRPEFREAAAHWYNTALQMRVPGSGVGGYLAWHGNETRWVEDPTFLTGAAGIALAFLAAASPVEPSWDVVLMARLRAPRAVASDRPRPALRQASTNDPERSC